jgi:rod shape-determining protein MreB
MDEAIVDYLRRHYSLRIGLSAAERLKIEIGSAYPLEEERAVEISGVDTVSGLPRRATVTSEEIRQALGDPLREILEAVKAALDRCSPDLAADLVQNGIVLCGGGSLLQKIDRFLNEQTGLPVRITPEPLTAVAQGLLICMEHFPQWRRWLRSSEEDV